MTDFGFVKAAALSPRVTVANPEENVEKIIASIRSAADGGAQIIALPELCISGYTCSDLFSQDRLIESSERALQKLLESTADISALCITGLPVRACGRLYNCAAVFQSGSLLGVVPKSFLPNYNEFYEKRHFKSGLTAPCKSVRLCNTEVPFGSMLFCGENGAVIGVEICEDMWVPVSPGSILALSGANIIVNISASNEMVTKNDFRKSLIEQTSARCYCGYVYSSAGVGESTTDLVFSGACTIAENGATLAENERFERGGAAVSACIDVKKLEALRRNSEFYDNASYFAKSDIPCIPVTLPALDESLIDRKFEPHPFVPQDEKVREKRCGEILNIQAAGLAKRMEHTGIKKAIIGISGGLDSALALLVTDRAFQLMGLPKKNIICVTMPGFGTTNHTKSSAVRLTECIGAELRQIDIVPACTQHMRDIGHDMNVLDVTYENVQARERTQILMDIANKECALLVGTGDLSELALGWCTYNADHMSMYGVNCSVPKTLVRYIVDYEAKRFGGELGEVLRTILETPVSPELLPPDKDGKIAQKTEDTLGPYEVHDFFLYHFERFGTSPEKLMFMASRAFSGVYTEDQLKGWLRIFVRRFFSQQFKRSCVPDGPKVGSVSLSPRGDWRMPSDADCSVWLDF
ncbi:MAG: NAD(+) synthase [Clostridia bacterium]|nr:NAD(+) synthase [Oscillospiraceae bacterium]MDD6219596.1 NAD(+) synthase [Clostridia bacterium]